MTHEILSNSSPTEMTLKNGFGGFVLRKEKFRHFWKINGFICGRMSKQLFPVKEEKT